MFKYGGIQNFFVKILIGLLFLGFSVFALISLITHNEVDPKIFSVSPDNDIKNFFGIYGAYFSSTMLLFINKLTYLLIAFCFFHSIKLMFGIRSNYISLKILSMILVIIHSNVGEEMMPSNFFSLGGRREMKVGQNLSILTWNQQIILSQKSLITLV